MKLDAFQRGLADYNGGVDRCKNPYDVDSPDNDEWDVGWLCGLLELTERPKPKMKTMRQHHGSPPG